MLRIPLDKIETIVSLARGALGYCPEDDDTAEPATGGDGHPLPSTEDYESVSNDALFDYVDALNGDELADLLALSWLGSGEASDWPTAQKCAEEELADGDGLAELLQNPTLPDALVVGLEALGYEGGEGPEL